LLNLINPWYWLDGEPLEDAVSRCLGDATSLNTLLQKVLDYVSDVLAIVVLSHDGTVIDLQAREEYPLEKLAHMAAAYGALAAQVSPACGYGEFSTAWLKVDEVYLVVIPAPQILIAMIYRRDFKI